MFNTAKRQTNVKHSLMLNTACYNCLVLDCKAGIYAAA